MSTGFPVIDSVLEIDAEFASIIASREHPAEEVASFLKAQGHQVSASTIRTYRRALAAQQGV